MGKKLVTHGTSCHSNNVMMTIVVKSVYVTVKLYYCGFFPVLVIYKIAEGFNLYIIKLYIYIVTNSMFPVIPTIMYG